MKKKVYILIVMFFLFMIPSFVMAAPSLTSFINAIRDGDITKEYKKGLGKEYHDVVFDAYINDSTNTAANVEISMQKDIYDKKGDVIDTKTYSETFTILTDTEHNFIYSESEYKDKYLESEDHFLVNLYYTYFPLWGVEASDKYNSDIVPLFNDKESKTKQLSDLIDKCYFSEYGLCYTTLPNSMAKSSTLTGKVELSDKGANFIINKLQEKIRKEKQDKLMIKLSFVLIILILLFVIAKAGGKHEKRRVLKY